MPFKVKSVIWCQKCDVSVVTSALTLERNSKVNQLNCFGWVPCFLVSRPLRSRDEFFVVVRSYSIYHLERLSNEVTTFLTLDNVYILV